MSKKRSESPRHLDATTADVTEIIDASRRIAARSVNAAMIGTFWVIGRRIAEQERRSGSPMRLSTPALSAMSAELIPRYGKTYTLRALRTMAAFFQAYPKLRAGVTLGSEKPQSSVNYFAELTAVSTAFSLSWAHYVRLVKVDDPNARAFYESEALRQGWNVRQMSRRIREKLYARTSPPRDPAAVRRATLTRFTPADLGLPDEVLRDPTLRHFFDVPPGGRGSSRAREAFIAWLTSPVMLRERPAVWLQ